MNDTVICVIVWASVAVVLGIAEAVSVQLVAIWPCIGAVCALIATVFGAPLWLQMVVFILITALLLLATRPAVKRIMNRKMESTNADRVLGQTGVVVEQIDNVAETGRVLANGLRWRARAEQGTGRIAPDSRVSIQRIEGATLIVSPLAETPEEAERSEAGPQNG